MIPPAAITGHRIASATAGTRTNVPTSGTAPAGSMSNVDRCRAEHRRPVRLLQYHRDVVYGSGWVAALAAGSVLVALSPAFAVVVIQCGAPVHGRARADFRMPDLPAEVGRITHQPADT